MRIPIVVLLLLGLGCSSRRRPEPELHSPTYHELSPGERAAFHGAPTTEAEASAPSAPDMPEGGYATFFKDRPGFWVGVVDLGANREVRIWEDANTHRRYQVHYRDHVAVLVVREP